MDRTIDGHSQRIAPGCETLSRRDREDLTDVSFRQSYSLGMMMPSRKTSALDQYAESLPVLEQHIAECRSAAAEVWHGANIFLEWMTARIAQKEGLRKADVHSKARALLLPGAIEALSCIAAPETVKEIFKFRGMAYDFDEKIDRFVPLAELHGPVVREQVEATANLLFEIVDFCKCHIHVERATVAPGQRTRDSDPGREYCKLCFRPSQRYLRRHSCTMMLEQMSLGRVVGNTKAVHCRKAPVNEWLGGSDQYCEDRHSGAGTHSVEGRELSAKNHVWLSSDMKPAAVGRFRAELEQNHYEANLTQKGLENPRSMRLRRRVAFYRGKPRKKDEQKEEIQKCLWRCDESEKRIGALHVLLDHVLSAFWGFRFDDLPIDDDLLLIEANPTGVITVRADGSEMNVPLVPVTDPSERLKHFENARRCIDRLLDRYFEKHARPTVRRAYFETLGVEVFLEMHERIRWVFDSPTWLSRACDIDLKKP